MKRTPQDVPAFFPVSAVLGDIKQRLDRLKIGVSLHMLRQHVRKQHFAADPDHAEDHPYCQTYLTKRAIPRSAAARYHRDFLNWGLNVLEAAILSCEKALAPEPKPLRTLILEGQALCHQFDQLEAQYYGKLRTLNLARARGGSCRHKRQEPAWQEAARLLKMTRPPGGWPTPTAAAKAIAEELMAFIHAKRIPVVTGDNLLRTIVRWIRERPMVTAAFLGKAA